MCSIFVNSFPVRYRSPFSGELRPPPRQPAGVVARPNGIWVVFDSWRYVKSTKPRDEAGRTRRLFRRVPSDRSRRLEGRSWLN